MSWLNDRDTETVLLSNGDPHKYNLLKYGDLGTYAAAILARLKKK